MNNEILINGKIYKLESIWKKNKKDKSKDIKGFPFPFPKNGNTWSGQLQFINRLTDVQNYLLQNTNSFNRFDKKDCMDCLLCSKKCIVSGRFILGVHVWDTGLIHYVEQHNIKPSETFIEKIFNYDLFQSNENILKISGRIKIKKNKKFLKLDKNQIMIFDALMRHGGYNKKYYDDAQGTTRYSEHAGFIDIRERTVHNIIVSGNTLRVDRGDEEIFLPISGKDTYKYKYIFHTHPPTPKPGGRAIDGILYEFPSVGDILHFIDHHNDGHVVGSLVMTSEGLYNIRKISDNRKINIDEDKLYNEMRKIFGQLQDRAIKKYGTTFNSYTFYSKISQDFEFINTANEFLKKYDLIIDFFPRNKDFKGNWIVDTIYVPL